jgi:hypothetical protein
MSDQAVQQPFNREQEEFNNELRKEKHRRNLEWVAAGIVMLAFVVAVVGFFYFQCEKQHAERNFCQTIFTSILGAATAYVLKSTPVPPTHPKSESSR